MTRVTFGVAASSYAANMAVKQNAIDLAQEYPAAAKAVHQSFYVDDGLIGADSLDEAVVLQKELQALFDLGGFTLRKWNSSNPTALQHVPADLKESHSLCALPESSEYTKTLGIEWNTVMDHFRLTIAKLPHLDNVTKRVLISDVGKTFDVLGWFSPCMIKMKILFQQLWEMKVDWDDTVPDAIREAWLRWRSELNLLSTKYIPRCYFEKTSRVSTFELHGFSDASEQAYAAVVYLRMVCTDGDVQVALITSKTKVAPIRKWNSSNPTALQHVPADLKESHSLCALPESSEYTKTLGIEWNTVMDHFRLTIAKLPHLDNVTKRVLISDVGKTFDVLGWFSPCMIKMKILFQQLWEMKVDWDDTVPDAIREAWLRWRSELNLLSTKYIPRCYFEKTSRVSTFELHGFSDASEQAYAAVVYLRMVCTDGDVQVALITSKTKVAPINRLSAGLNDVVVN